MDFIAILGNLIVLGIVGIVLTLFRRADKNSKSLEQINRYATKRTEEFNQYVEEKVVELKDLSVGLEVQEKTGIVILKKIAGEVDALSQRIEHIEELNKKVTGYNATMDKMLSLSKELDDRYKILKQDSTYIEGVDKRVKDGYRKLLSVEKGIKDITAEFIKNNNNSVQKLKEVILTTTSDEIKALDRSVVDSVSQIDKLNEKLDIIKNDFDNSSESKLQDYKHQLDSLINEHKDSVSKLTMDAKEAEDGAFKSIKDIIESRSDNLLTILNERIKEVDTESQQTINKLATDIERIEIVTEKLKTENSDRLESIKDQLDKQLLLLKDANAAGVNSLQQDFFKSFDQFKQLSQEQIDNAKDESRELLDEIKKQFTVIEEQKLEAKEKLSNTEDYIQSEYNELRDRVDGSVYEITRELSSQEEKIKDEAIKYLENNIHLFKDEVDNKIEELTGTSAQIDEIKSSLLNKLELSVDEYKTQVDIKIEDLAEVTERVDNLKGEFTNKITDSVAKIEHDIELVNSKQSEFNESLNDLVSKISVGDDEIKTQIERHNLELKEELIGNIELSINSLKEQFDNKLETFSNFELEIDNAKGRLTKIIDEKYSSIDEDYTNFHQTMNEKITNEKEMLLNFIEEFNCEKVNLEQQINDLKEKSYNNISEKLNLFEDDYFAKLKEKEDFIETETDRWKDSVESTVSQIKEDSLLQVQNNIDSLNTQVDSFKENINSDISTFKDDTQNMINDMLTELKESEKSLQIERDTVKVEVSDDIRILRDELSNLQSEVSDSTQSLSNTLDRINVEQEKFIQDTQIFDRADKLRDELKASVEVLSNQVTSVSEKSGFISGVKAELEELSLLTSKVNSQIEGVDNKKNIIDSLDSRVSEVIELSESVDDKLNRLKDSDDKIGEVQLSLRNLKELEVSVKEDLERLERKQDILTETNKAIDSGFSHIQVIENKLDALKDNLIPFNNQIDNVKEKLTKVEEKEGRIDRAIETLSTLDSSVKDLDEKIEKMDTAREWIAGVETRLNESVRTANEQVKLMGALAQNKSDKKSVPNGTGAPNMNMRDMVIKLAHNNWKPEDIARTTKLSLGEVELILELSPRK